MCGGSPDVLAVKYMRLVCSHFQTDVTCNEFKTSLGNGLMVDIKCHRRNKCYWRTKESVSGNGQKEKEHPTPRGMAAIVGVTAFHGAS